MSFLELPPPDWASLPGGLDEARWIAASDRKVGLAAERGAQLREVARALEARKALFRCSPRVLREVPAAAHWYLKLAGMAQKTLSNIRAAPASFGLEVRPGTLADNLAAERLGRITDSDLDAFSRWINSNLDRLFPKDKRSPELALDTVLLIEGGSLLGKVIDEAGGVPVDLLKSLLISSMAKRRIAADVRMEDGTWREYTPELDLAKRTTLGFGGRLVCELVPGGEHADIRITLDGVVVLVGEVKGRKDLSNLWESWVPQVVDHLRTWIAQYPDAPRVLFGTIFTEEMIKGQSAKGPPRAGLRTLQKNGLLQAAYNLSHLVAGQPAQVAAFGDLIDRLAGLLKTGRRPAASRR